MKLCKEVKDLLKDYEYGLDNTKEYLQNEGINDNMIDDDLIAEKKKQLIALSEGTTEGAEVQQKAHDTQECSDCYMKTNKWFNSGKAAAGIIISKLEAKYMINYEKWNTEHSKDFKQKPTVTKEEHISGEELSHAEGALEALDEIKEKLKGIPTEADEELDKPPQVTHVSLEKKGGELRCQKLLRK